MSFQGELRPEQREAVGKLLSHDIGVFGGGKKKPGGKVDVAIMQSLVRRGVVDDRAEAYGHAIFDECRHLSAPSFEAIARRVKARYVLGLSATVARKDGKHPVILMQCGPIRHRVDAKLQAKARPFLHTVFVHPTGFHPPELKGATPRDHFHELYTALIEDKARNEMIVSHVAAAARQRRYPIVLTERTEHLEALERLLEPFKNLRDTSELAASSRLHSFPPYRRRKTVYAPYRV